MAVYSMQRQQQQQQAAVVYVYGNLHVMNIANRPLFPSIDDGNGIESRPKEFISQLGSYSSNSLSLRLCISFACHPPPTLALHFASVYSLEIRIAHCLTIVRPAIVLSLKQRKKIQPFIFRNGSVAHFQFTPHLFQFRMNSSRENFFSTRNKSATCVGEGHSVRRQ